MGARRNTTNCLILCKERGKQAVKKGKSTNGGAYVHLRTHSSPMGEGPPRSSSPTQIENKPELEQTKVTDFACSTAMTELSERHGYEDRHH